MSSDGDRIALIVNRHIFYQKNYRRLLVINIVLLILICLLAGFLHYQTLSFAVPQYFPTTPDGVVIDSPPDNINHLLLERMHFNNEGVLLEYPEINSKDLDLHAEDSNEHAILLFWATRAMLRMFELDFVNYRAVIQDMRKYFSSKGYERFLEALDSSKNLDTIKKGKRVAYATLQGPAKVTETGMLEGHKVWNVEAPMVVTYEAHGQDSLTQDLLAIIKIARVSTLQSPFYGLAIYQVNFKVK
jgi:intracellular multiplication protein IcmL